MNIERNEENHGRHLALVAMMLANTKGDLINSGRLEWHTENHLKGGKPTEEEMKRAAEDYMVISELMAVYRDFYGEAEAA